jgi:twitching motility protein PilT
MAVNVSELFNTCCMMNVSDLHLTVGVPPIVRVNGRLTPLSDQRLTPADTESAVRTLTNEEQFAELEKNGEVDFSVSIPGSSRYRVNAYRQRGSYAAALRLVASTIRTVEELQLPPVLNEFCWKHNGLVLVTGPTGSGKSTTLAAMIDNINSNRDCHIITLEEPIEYLHRHKKSMVNQREIGSDSLSYANALRAALREDPDVILIGEMRDYDSISIALTAAETGHLVFSTLHTVGAAQTIDRIIDVFPPHQQQQIRVQLSMTLQGVVSQQLIPLVDGSGRIAAVEVMLGTPAIRNLIREGKTPQINNVIMTGAKAGMQLMDNSIAALLQKNMISYDDAYLYSVDQDYLTKLMKNTYVL